MDLIFLVYLCKFDTSVFTIRGVVYGTYIPLNEGVVSEGRYGNSIPHQKAPAWGWGIEILPQGWREELPFSLILEKKVQFLPSMTCPGITIPLTLNCEVLQYPLKVAEEFLYLIS